MAVWRTYTPDGRMLEVEHTGGEQASIGTEEHTIEAWISAHAARFEDEAG